MKGRLRAPFLRDPRVSGHFHTTVKVVPLYVTKPICMKDYHPADARYRAPNHTSSAKYKTTPTVKPNAVHLSGFACCRLARNGLI